MATIAQTSVTQEQPAGCYQGYKTPYETTPFLAGRGRSGGGCHRHGSAVELTPRKGQFRRGARGTSAALHRTSKSRRPPPKLIVDPPLPEGLAQGIFWAQYRVENVRILQVFGPGALNVSPRIGHLHISVNDLPWLWADASDNNTVDIAGLPPGEHKVKIDLVDANHNVFPGQSKTVTFTIP